MKHFFQAWISSWLSTLVPVLVQPTTLAEREKLRKRQLLCTIMLMAASASIGTVVLYLLSGLYLQMFLGFTESLVLLFALWINQRGHIVGASLLFFASEIFNSLLAVHIISISDPHILLWGFPPMTLLLTGAGMFLPASVIVALAVGENILVFWYLFTIRHNEIVHFLTFSQLSSMLIFLLIMIYVSATIGILYTQATQRAVLQADRAIELEQAHRSLTETYASLEKAHSDLEVAHTLIQKQALTDGLTGLPNHRALLEQLAKELDRARRYDRAFSILFFDADRFKQVNDVHGHAAGDSVLRQIGERVSRVLRGGDVLGRFGGEEFVVLLPEANAEEAKAVAERMRTAVANEPMILTEAITSLNITVSIGIATYPTDGYGEQELLQQADQAMYLAKRLGRNQVRTAVEAIRMTADAELMAMLQQEGKKEAAEREGITPERIRENYTVKIICSLMTLLERRDHGMSQHAYAVSDLATSIAQAMELEPFQISRIGMAALLHDIGKVAIPDMLLQKANRLASHERAFLREHAELGAQILEASPFLHDLMPAVHSHHEYWDGSGYPDGLAREEIPIGARIIAVAEAYDAMRRDRPYQSGRTAEEALAELWRCAGTQFDPEVVRVFSNVLVDSNEHVPVAWREISASVIVP